MQAEAMREFDISGRARRRCLDGVNILLVEDSLSASEAMRLMALSCGARLRRADNIETGLKHLRVYRPDIVIVDLGLPDGDGLELISEIAGDAAQQTPALIAISGADSAEWAIAARKAGAQVMLTKPVEGIDAFQDALLSVLPDRAERAALRRATRLPDTDGETMCRDMDLIRGQLSDAIEARDEAGLCYAGRFVEGLARGLVHRDLGASARALYLDGAALEARIKAGGEVLAQLDALAALLDQNRSRGDPPETGS